MQRSVTLKSLVCHIKFKGNITLQKQIHVNLFMISMVQRCACWRLGWTYSCTAAWTWALWGKWQTLRAAGEAAFSGEALMRFLSLCDELFISLLCMFNMRTSKFCFSYKQSTQRKVGYASDVKYDHGVFFFVSFWLFPSGSANHAPPSNPVLGCGIPGWTSDQRVWVLLPNNFHDPGFTEAECCLMAFNLPDKSNCLENRKMNVCVIWWQMDTFVSSVWTE